MGNNSFFFISEGAVCWYEWQPLLPCRCKRENRSNILKGECLSGEIIYYRPFMFCFVWLSIWHIPHPSYFLVDVCADMWEGRRPAGLWRTLLWSLSPAVYWHVGGAQGKIPLSWMQHWWVHLLSDRDHKMFVLESLSSENNYFICCPSRCPHLLCV